MNVNTMTKQDIVIDIHYWECLADIYEAQIERNANYRTFDLSAQSDIDETIRVAGINASTCRRNAKTSREMLKNMVEAEGATRP